MQNGSHNTAVVIIPPEEVCGPIQAIREQHDREFGRWMPHVRLIYPFRPKAEFDQASRSLAAVCKRLRAFDLSLTAFDFLGHGKGYYTVGLKAEPEDPIYDLHDELRAVITDDEDFEASIERFWPHLSVGRVRGMANTVELKEQLQTMWTPVRFTVSKVDLIWRNNPPDDVFRVDRSLPLGRAVPSA